MNQNSILHFIKTKSLLSDGRLLKWIDCLERQSISSKIIVLEDSNTTSNTIIGKLSHAEHLKLYSRTIFKKKGNGFLFKIPEYAFKSFIKFINSKEEIVVFHDNQHYLTFLLLLLTNQFNKRKIIWDLHELPHSILFRFAITRTYLKTVLEKCFMVIHTNEQRRDFLHSKIKFTEKNSSILNNFPELEFICSDKKANATNITTWLNGEPYILWLGVASKTRCFDAVFDAYKRFSKDYKLIILGSVAKEFQQLIVKHNLSDRIWHSYVNQSEIIKYIDNAAFSIVLYKNNSPNNFYCEPNRLYQLLSRKIPIIVGANPRLSEIIENKNFGIVLEDDGSDVKNMIAAIEKMKNQYAEYKNTLINTNFEKIFSWENQFSNVIERLNRS